MYNEIIDIIDLSEIEYAIGDNGISYKIKYSHFQNGNHLDNGRQLSNNFDNEAGHVYILITQK
jgi:hypothetical protein